MDNILIETAGKGTPPIAAVQIRVFFDPKQCSKNQRLHWAERARRNKAASEAARIGWLQAGQPRVAGPVRASFTVYRGRRMDEDNLLSGMYPVVDALFKGAVTPDDSPRYLTIGGVQQVTGADWRRHPMVDILIEPLADENASKYPLDYPV